MLILFMCFHNSINTDTKKLEAKYKAKLKQEKFIPVFHASGFTYPSWPIISNKESTTIQPMQWGLIPHWIKTDKEAKNIKAKTLNARIETIKEKPSFVEAAALRRCLIPSTGFFEWQDQKGIKIPYFIHLRNQEIFSLAGIWGTWVSPQQELIQTFSILTTEANLLMQDIHNTKKRMPVILLDSQEKSYLNGDLEYNDLKKPIDLKEMEAHTISKLISGKDHNTVEVTSPYTYSLPQQLNLF